MFFRFLPDVVQNWYWFLTHFHSTFFRYLFNYTHFWAQFYKISLQTILVTQVKIDFLIVGYAERKSQHLCNLWQAVSLSVNFLLYSFLTMRLTFPQKIVFHLKLLCNINFRKPQHQHSQLHLTVPVMKRKWW